MITNVPDALLCNENGKRYRLSVIQTTIEHRKTLRKTYKIIRVVPTQKQGRQLVSKKCQIKVVLVIRMLNLSIKRLLYWFNVFLLLLGRTTPQFPHTYMFSFIKLTRQSDFLAHSPPVQTVPGYYWTVNTKDILFP